MAILQALISLITKSAGKILNAIFGWAVVALFGQTSPGEQTMLSAVVAAAAAWPLLVLGIAVPRVTLFVVARELSRSDLPFDESQIVYRELLQLDRALRGEPPLLVQEEEMADGKRLEAKPERIALPPPASVPVRLESMSNKELLQHIVQNATLLAKKEVELAKTELKADLKNEVAMAKGLTVAGLCAIWTVSMMLVAVAMALGTALPEWAAALIVAAAVLLVGTVAGLVGWGKRVKEPLETTRRTLKEDMQWAKERIA